MASDLFITIRAARTRENSALLREAQQHDEKNHTKVAENKCVSSLPTDNLSKQNPKRVSEGDMIVKSSRPPPAPANAHGNDVTKQA